MNWTDFPKISEKVAKELDSYDEITSQLLFNREINNKQDAKKFFDANLSKLTSPFNLSAVETASRLVLEAVKDSKKIFIYGDYDVDGVTATSILFDFLYRKLGANVVPYIPSRFDEGYGMNEVALEKLLAQNAGLIITVDCGIRDGRLVEEFTKKGLNFIITDHHEPPEDEAVLQMLLKNAKAVIHPMLSPDYEFKSICAATVAWKFVDVISQQAKKEKLLKETFDIYEYLDLVALGTVCDIMPLIDENRIILRHGLERMKITSNIGLEELMKSSGIISDELDTYHLGYVIGPRLNAAGRVKEALDAVRLLTSSSKNTVREKARELSELNSQRQIMTTQLLEEAEKQLISWGLDKKLYFIVGEEWPEGIIGLVAGKICEKYNKPVLVASVSKGKAVGSARSIKRFHITDAISESSEILERFGGHAQAAGFTLDAKNIEEFKHNMLRVAELNISESDLEKTLKIEINLTGLRFDIGLLEIINRFAPFGFGNKQPNIRYDAAKILSFRAVGKTGDHLKLSLSMNGQVMDAIGFGLAKKFMDITVGQQVNVAGYLEENNYNGNVKMQLKVIDLKVG